MHLIHPVLVLTAGSPLVDAGLIKGLEEITGSSHQLEELEVDADLLRDLTTLNLLEQAIPLQDHFIRVRQATRKHYFEVTGLKEWFHVIVLLLSISVP
jgi:hypothetical protein